MAFLAGASGLSVIAFLVTYTSLASAWDSITSLLLLGLGNGLSLSIALLTNPLRLSFHTWSITAVFQVYFAWLERGDYGLYLLPPALLLLLAAGTGIVQFRQARGGQTDLAAGDDLTPEEREALLKLTPRERDVLNLIAAGKTNKEIANLLVISPNTVRHHVHKILRKLNCSSRHKAAALARRAMLNADE